MSDQVDDARMEARPSQRAPKFVAIPISGLSDCARAMRMGFESPLAKLILRMTWGGKQWRLYLGLTIPFILICALQSVVSVYLAAMFRAGTPGATGSALQIMVFLLRFPLAELVLAVGIGIGIRRFIHSKAYLSELRVTPNSRGEFFRAAMAGYLPLMMLLYFVVQPVAHWTSHPAPWLKNSIFSQEMDGKDLLILAWRMFLHLLGYFEFSLHVLLAIFLVVRAPSLSGGIAVAVALLALLQLLFSCLLPVLDMVYTRLQVLADFTYRQRQAYPSAVFIFFFYRLVHILALGVVWHLAQRRFERGLLPLEEGFE